MDDFFSGLDPYEPNTTGGSLNLEGTQEEDEEEEESRPSSFFSGLDIYAPPGQQRTQEQEQEEDTDLPVPEGFTGQFLTGRNYRVVRDYMEANFGMTEDRYSREDLVDAYVNNMRGFQAGNSVRVVSELSKLYQAGDDKTKYEEAYRLWDESSGVFSSESGATTGERIEGVLDYARAAILDPANLFTFGAGKLAGIAAGRVAAEGGRRIAVREVAQQGIRQAVTEAGEEAATRAAGRTALQRQQAVAQARNEARERTTAEFVEATTPRGQLYQDTLRRSARAEVLGGTGMEILSAGALDVAYQDAMIEANVQEEFSPLQFALSTFVPAAIGGVALARATGSTDINRIVSQNTVQTAIERSNLNRVNSLILAGEEAVKSLDDPAVSQRITRSIEDGISGFRTWREKVESGELILDEADKTPIRRIDETLAVNYFLNGAPSLQISGLGQALVETFGLETLEAIGRGSANTSDQVANALEFLPRFKQLEVIDFFNQTVGSVAPSLKMDSMQDLTSYLSADASQAGRRLSSRSVLDATINGSGLAGARALKGDASKQSVGKTVVDNLVKGTAEATPTKEAAKEIKDSLITRLQNNYVRTLVTHPGTTMLNLSGWAQMSSINVMSNTLRGTIYGSLGLIEGLAKGNMKSSTYAHKAAMEFGSIKRELSNLVNPYATYDQAMSYLFARPEARKELFRYIAGGVESGMDEDAILRQAGIQGANPSDANFFEKYMQATQVLYGVRAVDFLSKTQAFMTSLDRQIRRRYGQSYEEFLQRDDFYDIMTSKNSEAFKDFMKIESMAVRDTLDNTFNRPFAGDDLVGKVAGIIENARTIPVVGALIPFGQFFNNTMALTASLTGASIPYHYYLKSRAKRLGKETLDKDPLDMATKMAVGWGLTAVAVINEEKNMEEGLPWYAERNASGAVVDRRYDFPWAAFKGYGRILAHYRRDGAVPEELLTEVADTVGFGSLTRQLSETYGSVVEGIMEVLSDPGSEAGPAMFNALEVAVAQYASGVTRSVDPLNQVLALSRGEDYEAIDRSIGNRNINNSIRYIDQFIEPFMDPERRPPVSATTGREPTAQTNRIFGYREIPAPSTVERMFADIGRPNWKTEIYVPDGNAGRILKEHVYPYLEYRAAEMLESSYWENANLEARTNAVRSMMSGARSEMMESLRESYDEPDRKAAAIYDIFNASLRARSRDRLIESYGVTPDTLWTLTEDQLLNLLYLIKEEARTNNEISRDIREGRL